jgi:hypothetical protein
MPNIFYFEEDSEMLEWFEIESKSEEYEEYRKMKN